MVTEKLREKKCKTTNLEERIPHLAFVTITQQFLSRKLGVLGIQTFLGTSKSMTKEPGFSTARAKPVKLGPLTNVASVIEALNLTSPALAATVAKAAALFFSSP